MKINQLSWMIGGPQGSGVDSGANIFSRACAYGGLHVFGKREYHSNIKGEHSNYVVRVDSKPIRSHLDEIDFLVTFDPETLFRHVHKVVPGGVIIYDVNQEGITVDKIPTIDKQANRRIKSFLSENGVGYSVKDVIEYASRNGILTYGIPYVKLLEGLAEELGDPRIARMDVMINVMAVASSFALLQYDFAPIERAINYVFKAKEKVAKLNIEAAKYVYKYVLENFERTSYKLEPVSKSEDGRIIIQGYQASALGKIAGGCRFQSYYPITPASDESVYLEDNAVFEIIGENGELEKGSIVVVQTEDGYTEVTVITRDAPFVLAKICGVLSANDANIFDAKIFTRKDGIVIDKFRVFDYISGDELTAGQCEKIKQDLEDVFYDRINFDELFEKHRRRWKRKIENVRKNVKIAVEFEDSKDYTIIDVFAPDSLGFLYKVSRKISELGLNIYFAKIATRTDGIVDSFYVLDFNGNKITDENMKEKIRNEILAVIYELNNLKLTLE